MKILIISQYYDPEQFQINEIAPSLVNEGHEITVLCGLPNYPEGKIYKGYLFGRRREVLNGVTIKRCCQFPRGRGKIGLILNDVSYMITASLYVLFIRKQYDLVFCYQLSPITMAIPAIIYKKITKCNLLLYCLDIFPESVLSHVNRGSRLFRIVARISQKIYGSCDKIAVSSRPFIQYISDENNVEKDKLVYIPQHASSEMLKNDYSSPKRSEVHFMFAGNIGYAQDLETLINACVLIPSASFVLDIVGDGSKRKELETLVRKNDLTSKVVFHGKKKRNEMPEIYKQADVLVITLRGDNRVGDTMPGKLQTYMTVGKPIVGAINGAAKEVIAEAGCGECVNSGDAVGLSKAMLHLINHRELHKKYGENARAFFRSNFTLECYMEQLNRSITELQVMKKNERKRNSK